MFLNLNTLNLLIISKIRLNFLQALFLLQINTCIEYSTLLLIKHILLITTALPSFLIEQLHILFLILAVIKLIIKVGFFLDLLVLIYLWMLVKTE